MPRSRITVLFGVLGVCVLALAGCLGAFGRSKYVPQPPSWLIIRPDFTPQSSRANPTSEPTSPPRPADGLPDPTWETTGIAPWVTPVAPEGALNAEVSPDGRTLVYIAFHPGTFYASLYQASTHGGKPIRLNGWVADQTFFYSQFSADSLTLVYHAAPDSGLDGLYSRALSDEITSTGSITLTSSRVSEFTLTSDGQSVIYVPDTHSVEGGGLWRVPAAGGTPQQIGREVGLEAPFQISPDGRVLAGNVRRGEAYEEGSDVYLLPIDGGTAIQIPAQQTLWLSGADLPFAFTPDSRQVVWIDRSQSGPMAGLYTMPVAGGVPQRLDAGDLPVIRFRVTDDSHYVVYQAGHWREHPEHGIFSVPVAGGTPLRLTPRLAERESLSLQATSPDSRWAMYEVRSEGDEQWGMTYLIPITGGAPIVLRVISSQFSPDGRWLIYEQDDPEPALYSLRLDGGRPIQLSHTLPAGYTPDRLQISPDSRYVLYTISSGMRGSFPLGQGVYLVPITGGPAVELTGATGSGWWVYGQILPDGHTVLLYVDYDGDDVPAIYALDLDVDIPRSTGAPP